VTSTLSLPPLSQLYRECFDDVWAALHRLGVPATELEDAVHDVFVVVHRRRESFEGRCGVRTWLFGIARRVAFRHRRTEARTQRRHRALASVTAFGVDPNEHMARREAWLALQRFLEELDRPQREAFVLGELERLDRRALGAALGVSPNTAYSRLRAARARFVEAFAGGRPSSRTVLAAGRDPARPPAYARQRVWLALGSGLGSVPGSAAATTTAWGMKTVLATVGLAGAVLGMVAAVAPGVRPGAPSARMAAAGDGPAPSVASTPAAAPDPSAHPLGSAEVLAAPPPSLPERLAPTKPRRQAANATASAAVATDLPAEAALLRTAHAALAHADPTAALASLREHRQRFPLGMLAEERDASLIRVECALGHHARARREARRFVAAHPRSAYRDAFAEACVDPVTNPAPAGDQ
jgi:RNA polymerase sigma factor (sigma-70 family)